MGMMNMLKKVAAASLAALALACCAEEEQELQPSLNVKWASRKMLRGKVTNPKPVTEYEGRVEWSCIRLEARGVQDWSKYNSGKDVSRGEFERAEYELSAWWEIEELKAKVFGGVMLTDKFGKLREHGDTEVETYLKVETTWPLKPGIKLTVDPDHEYTWLKLFASYDSSFFSGRLVFRKEASLHWYDTKMSKHEWDVEGDGFTCAVLKTSVIWKQSEKLEFGPFFEASYAADARIRKAWEKSGKNNRDNYVIGFKAAVKF